MSATEFALLWVEQVNACGYDPLSRLVQPCDGGPLLAFDGNNIVRTGADDDVGRFTFVQGPGTDDPLMGMRLEGSAEVKVYFITDGQGRQYAVGDVAGNDYRHNALYSAQAKYAGGTQNAVTFDNNRAGGPNNGLSFYRNRFYDAQTSRWISEDPIGIAGGFNLYAYAGNNPATYTDPFGLCPWCLGGVGGVATGYVLAKLTGSDYDLKDAVVDFGLGAAGAGIASKLDKINDARKASRGLSLVDDGAAGLRRQLAQHQDKLAKYRANPDAFDNKGFLKNAPTPEIRQRIIEGRIRNLENQIRNFEDQIRNITGGN